jgi:putative hemolysin
MVPYRTDGIESSAAARKLIDLDSAAPGNFSRSIFSFLLPLIEKVFSIDAVNQHYVQYYDKIRTCKDPRQAFETVLDVIEVKYAIDPMDLEKIPPEGALVVVANHPFGGIEGVILAAILMKVRSDVKVLGNYLLKRVAGIDDSIISVDPFKGRHAAAANLKGLKESIRWVKRGGALLTFPSGEVSSFRFSQRRVVDPVWSPHVGGIIRRTGAAVLPIYWPGKNSPVFQILGILHPLIRTAMLPRELMNKKGKEIVPLVGNVIPSRRLKRFDSDEAVINYLRLSNYFLKNREDDRRGFSSQTIIPGITEKTKKAVIDPVAVEDLEKDVRRLPADQRLVVSGDLAVYIAQSSQLPNLINEIGRLREITFRQVDEGTGNEIDLDRFDSYYHHLFLWNHAKRELIGAYRLGLTDEIIDRYGPQGLYTNQLFRFKPEFMRYLSTAIELGRSFIRAEYQRKLNSLMLLWRGVGKFLIQHPHYNVLFGPVSISQNYHSVSRNLIVKFLQANRFDNALSRFVIPRRPYRASKIEDIDPQVFQSSLQDVDDISVLVSEIEKDGKGIPILLRHYLKLNGQLISFNLDTSFSNVVDGLLLVDVPHNDPKLLKRWLGKDGCRLIRRTHGLLDESDPANEAPAVVSGQPKENGVSARNTNLTRMFHGFESFIPLF